MNCFTGLAIFPVALAEGTWQIVQCNGCETISFRESWVSSEDIDPEDGYIENVKIYPVRGKDIYPIKPFYNVPLKIRTIYREMIDAFNNGLLILCSGGLRATIEGICSCRNTNVVAHALGRESLQQN